MSMSVLNALFIAATAGTLLVACSSAEKRAHRNQAELNERKMEIVDDYEK